MWDKEYEAHKRNSAEGLKEFIMLEFKTVMPRTPTPDFWGCGHTAETDPTRQRWRCRRQGQVWLIGQPSSVGCASVMILRDGRLDVAIYLETPKEISDWLAADRETREIRDPRYLDFHPLECGGDGLRIIREIEKERETYGLSL